MNKGIKATLCITLAFALVTGIFTGCRDNAGSNPVPDNSYSSGSDSSSDNTIPVPVASDTTAPSDADDDSSCKSVKDDYNGELPETGKAGDYCFKILGKDAYRTTEKSRGYYIDILEQEDSPYYIVICSGEKNTGGYDIEIVDIGLQDGELLITVKETSPGPDDMVTQAIEYPCCVLELDKLPSVINIVNTDGVAFKDLAVGDI